VRPIDLRDRFEQAGPKSRVGKRHLRFKVEVDMLVVVSVMIDTRCMRDGERKDQYR
jgi:hypothetical protein